MQVSIIDQEAGNSATCGNAHPCSDKFHAIKFEQVAGLLLHQSDAIDRPGVASHHPFVRPEAHPSVPTHTSHSLPRASEGKADSPRERVAEPQGPAWPMPRGWAQASLAGSE